MPEGVDAGAGDGDHARAAARATTRRRSELSLGSAIVAEEWVEAHDLYGRNRP